MASVLTLPHNPPGINHVNYEQFVSKLEKNKIEYILLRFIAPYTLRLAALPTGLMALANGR
jgi:hypothetical protein